MKPSRFCVLTLLGASLILGLFRALPANAAVDSADSLRRALSASHDEQTRIALLINLSDLAAKVPDGETPYCLQLYATARQARDYFALSASLPVIAIHNFDTPGGAARYLDQADELMRGTPYDGMAVYYRETLQARELQIASREEKTALCERLMNSYEARRGVETRYERAERLFMQGVIASELLELTATDAIESGIPYWEEAWHLVRSFDLPARRLFAGNLVACLTIAYNSAGNAAKFLSVSDEYLALLDKAFSDPEILRRRPYIPKEASYMVCYQGLIDGGHLIGRERAHRYYLQYRKFVQSGSDAIEFARDNTFYYALSRKHYTNRGEYDVALAYCDSLIGSQQSTSGSRGVSPLLGYKGRAGLLRALGRFEEACATYERVIGLSDSLAEREYLDKVGEMEANLGVEKMQAEMLTQQRHNVQLFLSFVLLVAVGAGIYLYRNLRRERRLREALNHQCEVSQECGRMKTAFLNMMGHEIRTPLNVIGGFAEVLASGSVPASQQEEYLSMMQRHSRMLTSLMNDMLEVANLDNCSDQLPREPVDVRSLLREAAKYGESYREQKPLEFKVDLPEEEVVVSTNAGYLTHVLHELVKNGAKFTEQGSVTLGCRADVASGTVVCTVTDTGIGIEKDKAEFIFGQFAQIDTFVQGVGLGLYLCRLIMSKLGGTIAADPSYTGGLRVVVTLPLSDR